MRFTVQIGEAEKHALSFRFNQITGRVEIAIDGTVVKRDLIIFSLKQVRAYSMEVGTDRIPVRIEQERRLLFPALFPHEYRVYVGGSFFKYFRGQVSGHHRGRCHSDGFM